MSKTLNITPTVRMNFILFVSLIFILNFFPLELHSQNFRSLNFEGAGYVTGVFPVKYNPNFLPNPSNQTIYARTDVGGVYKSTDNGNSWKFISNFRSNMSPSELMIQGIAVREKSGHYSSPDTLLVAWGHNRQDALESGVYRSLWKSTDGGETWTRPTIEPPGVLFSGNNFKIKIGGECVVYHPDSANVLYMGGISPVPNTAPCLYKSLNGGDHWVKVNGIPFTVQDTITCISLLSGTTDIWVGTTRGVYRSSNNGISWRFMDNHYPSVKRILLQKFGNGIIAYVAYGNQTSNQSIARFTGYNNSWKDLSANFDQNIIYGNHGLSKKYFSALTLVKNYGVDNVLLAGRYERPLRISFNYGENWTGNGDPLPQTGDQVVFRYKHNTANFPNHQYRYEIRDFIYTGMNHIVQNPNDQFSNYWYSSGGAGAYKSEDGGILYLNSLNHSTWEYMVSGMSLPVVYDISFDPALQADIQIPISDWTNAYTTQQGSMDYSKLGYDRQGTNNHSCSGQPNYYDTYITNVTRALIVPDEPMISYNIGGNVYYHSAKMYKRTQSGMVLYQEICNLPWANTPDRVLSDGLVIPHSDGKDRLVVLLGASQMKRSKIEPGFEDIGVYRIEIDRQSSDASYIESSFLGQRGNDVMSQSAFMNALLPPLGTTSELFSNQFNLAKSDEGKLFLYLEGIEGDESAGGFFISNDTGANWQKVSDVVEIGEYKDEGCLKFNDGMLYLAIKNRGLYYSDNIENDTNWIFTKLNDFVSAEQVEVKNLNTSQSRKQIYVFGRRFGDRFNKIYRAEIDADGNYTEWEEIAGNIPAVRSLRINPNPDFENELWIATSGQGVIIYEHDGKPTYQNNTPEILPKDFSLRQNYPNPFNPFTRIEFTLPVNASVTLSLYDITGREVKSLIDQNTFTAGLHGINFNASDLASGVYFYRLSAKPSDNSPMFTSVKKMMLLR